MFLKVHWPAYTVRIAKIPAKQQRLLTAFGTATGIFDIASLLEARMVFVQTQKVWCQRNSHQLNAVEQLGLGISP